MSLRTGNGTFVPLNDHGETSLGAVTGGNRFFALPYVNACGCSGYRIVTWCESAPGSSHLRDPRSRTPP